MLSLQDAMLEHWPMDTIYRLMTADTEIALTITPDIYGRNL